MPRISDPQKKKSRKKKAVDPIALEQARVAEVERRHRETASLQARLQQLVEYEREMTASSSPAVEARWIVFLRECKQKELVSEIEVVKRTFEAMIDRVDAGIATRFSDLDEAEEEYRYVFHSHREIIDSLIQLQNRHIAGLKSEFEADLFTMKSDFELEWAELEKKHQLEVDDLQLILKNMAAEAELLSRRLQEETSEAQETAAEKMDEHKKQMQADLAKVSEALRSELDARYKEFTSAAQGSMKEYMDKSKEDQETTEHIESQLKKMDKLQETVSSWRTNIARNAKEWNQRNGAIQAERDTALGHLKQLKNHMQAWRQKQSFYLAELVKDAKSCEDSLQDTVGKAERILRLIELCRPLETEREQVLSHESHVSTGEIEKDVKRRVAAAQNEAAELTTKLQETVATGSDGQLLENFWTRFNNVVLDNIAIAQEHHHLESENRQLQTMLKQYLDDVSVNDQVMKSSNALLMSCAAPNVVQLASNAAHPAAYNYATVVEGNKFINETSRQHAR